MNNDLFYQIALTLIPQIGCVHARMLIEKLGDAKKVFDTSMLTLEKIVGTMRAENILRFSDFPRVEAEIAFIEKYNIQPLFFTDKVYPQRLLHCHDFPVLLFCKGEVNFNASHIIAIVGTRHPTDYGKRMTEKLLQKLAGIDVLVISGLAYGIDAMAHKYALKNNLPTVGVLGHGLDRIYPPQHKTLAMDMIRNGSLLTEFFSTTRPEKYNFPARNRIVAGMCDAVIVIETAIKGGSMITAEIANSYNKEVFAFPGKTTDVKSEGCNYLIKSNKAALLTDTQDFMNAMGWKNIQMKKNPPLQMFDGLNENEQKLASIIHKRNPVHIDELSIYSGLSSNTISAAILNMELQGIIRCLPGKRYSLV